MYVIRGPKGYLDSEHGYGLLDDARTFSDREEALSVAASRSKKFMA